MSAAALKREALPEEDVPGGAAAHPYAGKPLSLFQSITCVCDDCGHTAVLDRDKLLAMPAVQTFGALWKHAFCAECRAIGSPRRNVVLRGMLIEAEGPPERRKRIYEGKLDGKPYGIARRFAPAD